jgi:CRP/FNR family cyclic AMP-dependent transcriptional regulator
MNRASSRRLACPREQHVVSQPIRRTPGSSLAGRHVRSVDPSGAVCRPWSSSTFLGRLSSTTGERLLEHGTPMLYPKHRILLRQGDDGKHLVLLTRGVVKVVATSESGTDILLGIRVAGDLVGEMAAFEGKPRSGSVIACGEVAARIISLSDFERFLARHLDATKALMATLSARLRWANQRRVDSRAYDAPVRLARVLVELGRAHGRPASGGDVRSSVLGVMINQSELASLSGLALPTAEKALASLSRMGLVECSYRRITLCDVPELCVFAKVADEIPYL